MTVYAAATGGQTSNSGQPLDSLRHVVPAAQGKLGVFLKMVRPHNLVPSLLLVFVGAWAGAGRSWAALASGPVWAVCAISCGVAAASMVINDYFDFTSGVDQVNAPHKPLPSGTLRPDLAVLFSSAIYVAVLMLACLLEHPQLRAVVAFSAGATLLYTPLLKKVTALKNATVACIIAATPIAGAMAAGADVAILQRLLAPTAFVFAGIMHREILMDINDVKGDDAAGIKTLPVMVGRGPSLAVALAISATGAIAAARGVIAAMWTPFAAAVAGGVAPCSGSALAGAALSAPAAGYSSVVSTGAAAHATLAAAHHTPAGMAGVAGLWGSAASNVALRAFTCCCIVVAAWAQLAGKAAEVAASNFEHEVVASAVEDCVRPIGLALLLLMALLY